MPCAARRDQVADIMLSWLSVDVAVLNSGSLRTDDVIPAGPFRMRDLVRLLPMQDEVRQRQHGSAPPVRMRPPPPPAPEWPRG